MTRLLTVIPSLHGGGAERQLLLLLRYIERSRFDPVLCALDLSGPYVPLIPDDVEVVDLHKRSRWDLPRLVKDLSGVIRRVQPDVVFSKIEYANILTFWAARLARRDAPLVMGEEANLTDALELGSHRRARGALLRRAYRSAAAIVSPSAGAAAVVDGFMADGKRTAVIRNMVDIAEVEAMAAEGDRSAARSRARIVAVGRLTVEKGFEHLLRAMKLVTDEHPCELVIVGDGDQRAALERLVADLELEEHVSMPGFLHNPFAVMASGDVLAVSSVSESFGNVIIEGMALGLPIVSTRAPHGPEEIIDDMETGILVAPGDPRALADGLLRALSDDELCHRLGANARNAVAAYSAETVTRDYEELFGRVQRSMR